MRTVIQVFFFPLIGGNASLLLLWRMFFCLGICALGYFYFIHSAPTPWHIINFLLIFPLSSLTIARVRLLRAPRSIVESWGVRVTVFACLNLLTQAAVGFAGFEWLGQVIAAFHVNRLWNYFVPSAGVLLALILAGCAYLLLWSETKGFRESFVLFRN